MVRTYIKHYTAFKRSEEVLLLQESQIEIQGTEAFSRKVCADTDPVDSCPKAEPQEERHLTLYTLASRLQKQKARSNPYMVIFNSIGY
jgi:hypothetical protein